MSIFHRGQGYISVASNIAFVFADTATLAAVTISGQANGDLLVGGAMRTDVATAIALGTQCSQPTVGGQIEDDHIDGSGLGLGLYGIAGYKYCDEGGSELWNGWTGSQDTFVGIYRGIFASAPILAMNWEAGNANPVVYGALAHNDPRAWVVAFARFQNAVTAPPVLLTGARTVGTREGLWDSNGAMQNYAGESITASGAPGKWITCTLALRSS